MFRANYVEWSIKALYYVGGVASTVVGSLLSSKIRVYHDARNSHRDELKAKVLEPMRKTLASYGAPQFTVLYQAQQYNAHAPAGEAPSTYGPRVVLDRPVRLPAIDDVLLEDARLHHYSPAVALAEELIREWAVEAERHRAFIESVSNEILSASLLPAFPAPVPGPYVMHWNLGVFVYKRLVLQEDVRLWTNPQPDGQIPDCHILNDGQVSVAKGSEPQTKNIIQWIDGELIAKRQQACDFRAALAKLEKKRVSASACLGLANAEKRLKRRCALVRFF